MLTSLGWRGSASSTCTARDDGHGLDGSLAFLYHDAASRVRCLPTLTEVRAMSWEAPEFVEVKMDAEINSYQDDFDREQDRDDRF
jgi:hypothetical protein